MEGGREGGIAPPPSFGPPEGGAGLEGGSEGGRDGGGEHMYHQYQQHPDYNILGKHEEGGSEGGRDGTVFHASLYIVLLFLSKQTSYHFSTHTANLPSLPRSLAPSLLSQLQP